MRLSSLRRAFKPVALATAGLMLASASVAALPPTPLFSALYVFGDSLSDNGNLFALGGIPPSPPYFSGRASNGPVAVEYLATGLGLAPAQFHDLAMVGAYTGMDGVFGPGTGMTAQMANYSAALGGPNADPGALYFVWGGANDLRDFGAAGALPAITNLGTIVGQLYALGARHFMLPNLPDLGLTPEALANGAPFAAGATFLSEQFNIGLAQTYAGMFAGMPGASYISFDTMLAQRALVTGSPGNGFANVTDNCLTPPSTVCATPDTYLYWDTIHPTGAAHQVLGNQMTAAVPEPATMLLMAAGLLAVLGAGRQRRPRVDAAAA